MRRSRHDGRGTESERGRKASWDVHTDGPALDREREDCRRGALADAGVSRMARLTRSQTSRDRRAATADPAPLHREPRRDRGTDRADLRPARRCRDRAGDRRPRRARPARHPRGRRRRPHCRGGCRPPWVRVPGRERRLCRGRRRRRADLGRATTRRDPGDGRQGRRPPARRIARGPAAPRLRRRGPVGWRPDSRRNTDRLSAAGQAVRRRRRQGDADGPRPGRAPRMRSRPPGARRRRRSATTG